MLVFAFGQSDPNKILKFSIVILDSPHLIKCFVRDFPSLMSKDFSMVVRRPKNPSVFKISGVNSQNYLTTD